MAPLAAPALTATSVQKVKLTWLPIRSRLWPLAVSTVIPGQLIPSFSESKAEKCKTLAKAFCTTRNTSGPVSPTEL